MRRDDIELLAEQAASSPFANSPIPKTVAPQVGFSQLAAPHAPTIPRCWDKPYFSAAVRPGWKVTVGVNATALPANLLVDMPKFGSSEKVMATVVAGFCR